uniref:Uncharacterized protein n=1 Tax=Bionectria ochroleuca TaxID=29856 RepID=A0A8H7NIH0_BIOOC
MVITCFMPAARLMHRTVATSLTWHDAHALDAVDLPAGIANGGAPEARSDIPCVRPQQSSAMNATTPGFAVSRACLAPCAAVWGIRQTCIADSPGGCLRVVAMQKPGIKAPPSPSLGHLIVLEPSC